jgi:indole-3-glycerol phosphate synthase
MMDNQLNTIVNTKIKEIQEREVHTPMDILEQLAIQSAPVVSMLAALRDPLKTSIIAEFKRKSPSKGFLNEFADIHDVIPKYALSQASGVSILTDEDYFGGTVEDLFSAKIVNPLLPVLRKDFIIDPYQIIEARAIGADAILLIATILDLDEVISFTELAHALDMEVILEIHDKEDLSKYHDSVDIIGVNNRDLKTFKTNLQNSLELQPFLPSGKPWISESGINNSKEARMLLDEGFTGLLIGELFMREKDPGLAFSSFVQELHNQN